MDPERGAGGHRPRIGLVLGGGGVLGAAWMTGALPALQKRLPCAINDVELVVGTSAGSVVAAAVRCGVGVDEMVALNRGAATGVLEDVGLASVEDGPLPPMPRLRVGSPRLMRAILLAPHRVHPLVAASAWLPHGRGQHAALRSMVHTMHAHAHAPRRAAPQGSASPEGAASPHGSVPQESLPAWVSGQTWIVAVDYDSGERVIFGRPGAPEVRLPDAVAASCSIPGWYEPVVIDGRRYVDGGVRSATSLTVVARADIDEVYVLAPMASFETDRPRKAAERVERRLRRVITHTLLREVNALRSLGVRVTMITPGPEDLAVMGANLMDPRRRIEVLETSLRTSAAALASPGRGAYRADGGVPGDGDYPEDGQSKVA
jgi:NTE family protein